MRFFFAFLMSVSLLATSGCVEHLMGYRSPKSSMGSWYAYTFEGEYRYHSEHIAQADKTFTVEQWDSGQWDNGTYWLCLELSRPDDRWSPGTAGPEHRYTAPFANLFILYDQPPPFDVEVSPEANSPVSLWIMTHGSVYDLSDEQDLLNRFDRSGVRLFGKLELRRGGMDRLYVSFDIASDQSETGAYVLMKGDLLTHSHYGEITTGEDIKGIPWRRYESQSESTWP